MFWGSQSAHIFSTLEAFHHQSVALQPAQLQAIKSSRLNQALSINHMQAFVLDKLSAHALQHCRQALYSGCCNCPYQLADCQGDCMHAIGHVKRTMAWVLACKLLTLSFYNLQMFAARLCISVESQ